MLKHLKTPIRITGKQSDSNTYGTYGNGYYQAGEKVDDLENFVEEDVDDYYNLENFSVSSLSNLSQLSVDWSEHNRTAKVVWSRHTDANSDLSKAKARIKSREVENREKLLCDQPKHGYPKISEASTTVKEGNSQLKQNYPGLSKASTKFNERNKESTSSSSSSSEQQSNSETCQSKYQSKNKEKSVYAQSKKCDELSIDVENYIEKQEKDYKERKRYSTLQKMNTTLPNIDSTEQKALLPANLSHLPVQTVQDPPTCIIESTRWWKPCLDILANKEYRGCLVIVGFLLLFVIFTVLVSLAVKMANVQNTVAYIQDIFIDNVTFSQTFSRFDQEKIQQYEH